MGFGGEVVDVGAKGGRVGGHVVPGYWGEAFEGFLEGGHLVSLGRLINGGVLDVRIQVVLSGRQVGCRSRVDASCEADCHQQ